MNTTTKDELRKMFLHTFLEDNLEAVYFIDRCVEVVNQWQEANTNSIEEATNEWQQSQPVSDDLSECEKFALSFLAWYAHSEDAEIYKTQALTSYQIMQVYKSRPFLKTEKPEEN